MAPSSQIRIACVLSSAPTTSRTVQPEDEGRAPAGLVSCDGCLDPIGARFCAACPAGGGSAANPAAARANPAASTSAEAATPRPPGKTDDRLFCVKFAHTSWASQVRARPARGKARAGRHSTGTSRIQDEAFNQADVHDASSGGRTTRDVSDDLNAIPTWHNRRSHARNLRIVSKRTPNS